LQGFPTTRKEGWCGGQNQIGWKFAKKKNVDISQEELAKFGYRSVEEIRKISESSYISLACWNLLSKYWQFQNFIFVVKWQKNHQKKRMLCFIILNYNYFFPPFLCNLKKWYYYFCLAKIHFSKKFHVKVTLHNIGGYFFKHGNSFCNYACMLIQPLKIRSLNL
jgi:hypothetical protein